MGWVLRGAGTNTLTYSFRLVQRLTLLTRMVTGRFENSFLWRLVQNRRLLMLLMLLMLVMLGVVCVVVGAGVFGGIG